MQKSVDMWQTQKKVKLERISIILGTVKKSQVVAENRQHFEQ